MPIGRALSGGVCIRRETFSPIRSHHRTELAALTAPHARAERQHQHVVRPRNDVDLGVTDAVLAGHEEPADAVAAHVAERHGTGWRIAAVTVPLHAFQN